MGGAIACQVTCKKNQLEKTLQKESTRKDIAKRINYKILCKKESTTKDFAKKFSYKRNQDSKVSTKWTGPLMGMVLDSTFDRLANAVHRFAKFGLSSWLDIACFFNLSINNMFAYLQTAGQQGQLVAETVISFDAGLRFTSTLRPCFCLRSCHWWVFLFVFYCRYFR